MKLTASLNQEPEWLVELRSTVDPSWLPLLDDPAGAPKLTQRLAEAFSNEEMSDESARGAGIWNLIGTYYRFYQRWYDALTIYAAMYMRFLRYQAETGERAHKGMPLCWVADCYLMLNNRTLGKRYLMLTLVEDAITGKAIIDPIKTGVYFRLTWQYGMPDGEIKRYAKEALAIYERKQKEAEFPEYVLQKLDKNWVVEIPSANDSATYVANITYIRYLMDRLGDRSGETLEYLADYLLSCIPGCSTSRRRSSYSTDYDVVCSLQGPDVDFRSEFGQYFICECKDWNRSAGFTEIAKFSRVLDSIKARFGILFSPRGVSQQAKREQMKVFQDRGLVIVTIDRQDLEYVAQGGNFIGLLRNKYEQMRLDLLEKQPRKNNRPIR